MVHLRVDTNPRYQKAHRTGSFGFTRQRESIGRFLHQLRVARGKQRGIFNRRPRRRVAVDSEQQQRIGQVEL